MALGANRLTVIIVPGGHRRTLSLALPVPVLVTVVTSLCVGALVGAATIYRLASHYQEATAALRGLQALRDAGVAKDRELQQREAQLQQMARKVEEIEADLARLRDLESQVRRLMGGERPGSAGSASGGSAGTRDHAASAGAGVDLRLAPRERVLASRSRGASRSAGGGLLERLDTMKAEANRGVTALQRVTADLRERAELLAHKPSGLPARGETSDRFGWRWDPFGRGQRYHQGLDIAAEYGSSIHATADGEVVFSGWKSGGYGLTVLIDHGYGYHTLYAHNSENAVRVGDRVQRGQVVAYVGNTGNTTGPHVHYEVHLWDTPVDPEDYLE